jgi:hypothetical protein
MTRATAVEEAREAVPQTAATSASHDAARGLSDEQKPAAMLSPQLAVPMLSRGLYTEIQRALRMRQRSAPGYIAAQFVVAPASEYAKSM